MDQEKSEPTCSTTQAKRTRPLLIQPSPKIARLSTYTNSTSTSLLKNPKKVSPKKPKVLYNKSDVPAPGTPVPDKIVRKAGPYLLGPKLGPSPVKSIMQCLARKEKTDDFYQIKILTLKNEGQPETQDDRQGKMLLHTEYSLLSLLEDQDGVVHHHGLYKDYALEEAPNPKGQGLIYTGRVRQRLFLVLDCVSSHQFSEKGSELINLQQYVTKVKKVPEKEAIIIFYDIVRVVANLHKVCFISHLFYYNGSPAYISPDVLLCKPYLGKPSDMWALGVVLYTMLYGQFPFCDTSLAQLFNRIQTANYNIPPSLNGITKKELGTECTALAASAGEILDSDLIGPGSVVKHNSELCGGAQPSRRPPGGARCATGGGHIIVHPTNTEATQTQKQISIQRIGRDARPLLACEIARYQHMFTNRQETRRSETQNFVPESRENRTRTRNTRSIPSTSSEFRAIPWSERRLQVDQDYVLRFPDIRNSRIMNPAPVHSVNPEAVVNNPRPPTDSSDVEY
ncbi:unnamed protein product [Leptidea sinapis]|uniref:Protein kinase domain-containing protein n=1 Tax=Leptidea sinapis TaxID=189913 RepID=A0A5E4QBM5_9NEOP|nr:unnamed protein product [Leptidea sinapis]